MEGSDSDSQLNDSFDESTDGDDDDDLGDVITWICEQEGDSDNETAYQNE